MPKSLTNALITCLYLQVSFGAELHGGDRKLSNAVGVYHWSGHITTGVAPGLRRILDLGTGVARITISPRMAIDYRTSSHCLAGFRLPQAFDDKELQTAVADPRLTALLITAYDGAGLADCETHLYMNPSWYTEANTARVTSEYSDLVYRLYELYAKSQKTFVLLHWEGDNALYCGSVYLYLGSTEFRDDCHTVYSQVYGGSRGPADSIQGMILWMSARRAGLADGMRRAQADGLGGISVRLGIEINSVRLLRGMGFSSVLHDVAPFTGIDLVSYSAYEALAHVDPVKALRSNIEAIRQVMPHASVVLGEIGFDRTGPAERLVPLVQSVLYAALAEGVLFVIHWNLFDSETLSPYGIFDTDGRPTELYGFYKRFFEVPLEVVDQSS
ncbi:MAG: hypothetical protein SFV18_01840 [Bryobacteraceae bacterium]|nr:hypothetical protein [Bryobacteraceae bacterium]